MSKVYSVEEAIAALGQDLNSYADHIQKELKESVPIIAAQTHSFIVQQATNKLKSTRSTYLENLGIEKITSSADQEIWAVTLKEKAGFLEDGKEAYNAIYDLTHGPKSKVSKEGYRYNIIPFHHNAPPSEQSLAQNRLRQTVERQLNDLGMGKMKGGKFSLNTIKGSDGNPIIGNAFSTDLKGPLSKVGNNILAGVTVYQREVGKNKSIHKDIMTFRVVSEKQSPPRWDMPSRQGIHAFKEAEKQIDEFWNRVIKEIVEKY
jgi:hypothetical protein